MAQPDGPQSEPPPTLKAKQKFLKGLRFFGRSQHQGNYAASIDSETSNPGAGRAQSVVEGPTAAQDHDESDEPLRQGARGRTSRSVVPGLPRAQTFKRQLSENRSRLAPVEPTPEERRAVSMDRRSHAFYTRNYGHIDATLEMPNTFESGPEESNHQANSQTTPNADSEATPSHNINVECLAGIGHGLEQTQYPGHLSDMGTNEQDDDQRSIMSSVYHDEQDLADTIAQELETTWILNLSMRYKDRSNREKFFVTYREHENWRRVTVTLDYRDAPEESLEEELRDIRSQREKSSKIYESIRQSLQEIQFYETVTNLKLETTDGRLHVHVVEDANEIIQYPHVNQVAHLGCRVIREENIVFNHHMSGFVYKVTVDGQTLIKKEIPGPETIDEFLYEINALNSLTYSDNVIKFYGLVVDAYDQVKGLLISYADGGALIDIIYDNCKDKKNGIEWSLKERWAQQIVHGLADVHECGYVQGDFTLSNIVIDEHDNAKIIDINRRGCPVGWEPPEATPLIESQYRISMYIGVKSDLYQLGMVLWAIAMGEDEPEREGRPLEFLPDVDVPEWYRQITEICLSPDPRKRLQASMLLQLFPQQKPTDPQITVDDGHEVHDLTVNEFHPDGHPRIRIENLPRKFYSPERSYSPGTHPAHQPWHHYPPRGRSPPSPVPSNYDGSKSPGRFHSRSSWAANRAIRASYSDAGGDEVRLDEVAQQFTPNTSVDRGPLPMDDDTKGEALKQEDDITTSAVIAPDSVNKDVRDLVAEHNDTLEAALVEDAQATPTQETVGVAGDEDVKGAENILQEISGNITKEADAPEDSKNPADGDVVVLQESDEIIRQDPDSNEEKEPLEPALEPSDSAETLVKVDGEIEEHAPVEGVPEGFTAQEKGPAEEALLSSAEDGEPPLIMGDSERVGEPTPKTEKTESLETEATDPLPLVTTEPDIEDAKPATESATEAEKTELLEDESTNPTSAVTEETDVEETKSSEQAVEANPATEKTDDQEHEATDSSPVVTEEPDISIEEATSSGQVAETTPESSKTEVEQDKPADPVRAVTPEVDVEELDLQVTDAQNEKSTQISPGSVEETKAASVSDSAAVDIQKSDVEEKGEPGRPAEDKQVASETQSENQHTNDEAPLEPEHAPSDDGKMNDIKETDPLPMATTDQVPSETHQSDVVEAQSEAHIDIPALSMDNATPRISPSLLQDPLNHSDSLAGIGGNMAVDDSLIREKTLSEDDFQLVDRPPPALVVTTDTTT